MLLLFPEFQKISIYVLLLEDNKYYIGQSINPETRIKAHLKGKLGSQWTKKHKPLKLVEVIKTNFTKVEDALVHENLTTMAYMKRFGWRNVRGGDFCTLDETKLRFLLVINSDFGKNLLPLEIPESLSWFENEMCFFALKLQENNYYVGRTNNLQLAILNECNGLGSKWTKLYKPIKLIATSAIDSQDKEKLRLKHNRYVISYMKMFGFQKIRGGDFYNPDPQNHKNKVLNYTDIFKK